MTQGFAVNERNPFGLHYLKAVLAVGVIVIHGTVWIAEAADRPFVENLPESPALFFFFCVSMMVPISAGAVQAIRLRESLDGDRLRSDEPLGPFLLGLLFISALESIKAALVYTPAVFFGWNVIHCISVSLAVIMLLARRSIRAVWISAVLCLAVTPALRRLLAPWQIDSPQAAGLLHDYRAGTLFLVAFGAVCFAGFAAWLGFRSRLAGKYRLRLLLLSEVILLAYTYGVWVNPTEYYFEARLANLPIGALIGDRMGLHFWPLFPWYATVALGFGLYVWLSRTRSPLRARLVMGIAGIAAVTFYFAFAWRGLAAELSEKSLWSREIFSGSLTILAPVIGYFLLTALLYDSLSRARWLERFTGRHPSLYRVPFMFSKTILWSYLFVNTFGVWLARPFARVVPYEVAWLLYPIALVLLWYVIGGPLLEGLSRRQFRVVLKQVA